jgi:hypothetical protein
MRDDFEAPFDEQLQSIQAETAEGLLDVAQLPAALNQAADGEPFCFPYPHAAASGDDPATLLRELNWDPESRHRAAAMMIDYCDAPASRDSMLCRANDRAQLAAARILAVLICAEESAINIFHHECGRLEQAQLMANHLALQEIESEERIHNWLIARARAWYPEPEDLSSIRRRTRRLFMRVGSRDLATHFARITGLDSGVCISLSALLGSVAVQRISGFARLLRHIRHDEATHVKKSRDHAVSLGFDTRRFHECYELTRVGMVEMLTPIASSFEALDVDPDRMFRRLLRFQDKRRADMGEIED